MTTCAIEIEGSTRVEVVSDTEIQLITEAEQGPRGPQGPAGPAGGATLVKTAIAISGHTVVAFDANGELIYADCVTGLPGSTIGVTEHAYAPGDDAVVKNAFVIEHSGWSFSPGPVFVGENGQLTQTLPPNAVFEQVVGTALSSTVLHVLVQPSILKG